MFEVLLDSRRLLVLNLLFEASTTIRELHVQPHTILESKEATEHQQDFSHTISRRHRQHFFIRPVGSL